MRVIAGLCLAALCALAAPAAADMGSYPQTDEELQQAFDRLGWRTKPDGYELSDAHSLIRLRSGQALLLGKDAERYRWLNDGTEPPETAAVLAYDSPSSTSMVYIPWYDEGYISDADWSAVDADQLLEEYRRGTEAANDDRIDNGMEPMHVVGWLEKPHYDRSTNTVTYAIELKDKDDSWGNAFALRLGRFGYAEFMWVGSIGLLQSTGGRPGLLNEALAAHSFYDGYNYSEFREGDDVAAYGIAGLVAAAVGAKFGKSLFSGMMKFVVPAVLVFGAAIARFGRRLIGSES